MPILVTEKEARALIGKLPRSLENMVMHDPKGRKFFLRSQVMEVQNAKRA